jgi:Uma2 family endonuclease
MAETGIHVQAIILLHQALQDFFADRPDMFIASDMFWYWAQGDKTLKVAPDVMLVPGVGNHHRRTFNSFDEGGAIPAVVFEMASAGTVDEDLGDKYDRYEKLGVEEYFLFDPEAAHLVPAVQGFRLNRSAYRRLRSPNGELVSELGFRMRAEGTMLRLIDARTGELIPTREERATEAERKADEAERKAEQEKRRADALQAELDRLRAQLQQPPSGNSP